MSEAPVEKKKATRSDKGVPRGPKGDVALDKLCAALQLDRETMRAAVKSAAVEDLVALKTGASGLLMLISEEAAAVADKYNSLRGSQPL